MSPPVTTFGPDLSGVFETTSDRVFGFLLSRCGSRVLAEDLTAETFHDASRRFAAGHGHEVTFPWLVTVARRRLIDHWRAQATQQKRIDRLTTEAVRRPEPELLPDTRVDEALDSLSERQRAVLVLRYLEDFSVSEVADALEMSYKAAESLLSRARAAFARSYESSQ